MSKSIIETLTLKKFTQFEDLPFFLLMISGAGAFVISSYLALVFSQVITPTIEATRGLEFSKELLLIWSSLGFYAGLFWYTSCWAKRCHDVLYERCFLR